MERGALVTFNLPAHLGSVKGKGIFPVERGAPFRQTKLMMYYKYVLALCFAGCVLALDQATKIWIHTSMQVGDSFPVIPKFFDIQYVRNQGGAFGLFSESHEYVRWILFLFFPIVCMLLIFALLRDTGDKLQIIALGFIFGGAIGNYVDRVRLGYVIDFIDWYVKDFHWPIFNLADSFIVIGVFIMTIFYFLEKKRSS